MFLGPIASQKEESMYRWVGVSGAYYDDRMLCWVSADDAGYINVSGTVTSLPILLGSSHPEPILAPEPERRDKPFFIRFTRCKPPFELREDGVYLGERKIIQRVLPVE